MILVDEPTVTCDVTGDTVTKFVRVDVEWKVMVLVVVGPLLDAGAVPLPTGAVP